MERAKLLTVARARLQSKRAGFLWAEGKVAMPITVKCEACGKTLKVKDELAGKRGKCPGCGAVVHVPEASEPDESQPPPDDYKLQDAPPEDKVRVELVGGPEPSMQPPAPVWMLPGSGPGSGARGAAARSSGGRLRRLWERRSVRAVALFLAVVCIMSAVGGVVSLRRNVKWAKANKLMNGEEGWAIISNVANRNVARVEELLSQKPDLIKVHDARGGLSLLHHAAEGGDIAMGEMLLRRGADLGAVNSVGMTAIHEAAWWGQSAFVRFLVEHGDDVNRKSEGELTALHFALRSGYPKAADVLLELGAKTGAEDEDQMILAEAAVYSGAVESVEWVVAHPQLFNNPDGMFAHMLVSAGTKGHTSIVSFLESKGVKQE